MHDVRVINPPRHFLQQPVMPDIVKVGPQVNVENPRLPLDYCFSHTLDCVMCCPLRPISVRPRLESASNTGSRMSLSAPCTTLSRIAGIDKTRTLPPSFGISCFRAGSGL